jgi:hypothetical protein
MCMERTNKIPTLINQDLERTPNRSGNIGATRKAWYLYYHTIRFDLREFLLVSRHAVEETVYLLTRGPSPWMGE